METEETEGAAKAAEPTPHTPTVEEVLDGIHFKICGHLCWAYSPDISRLDVIARGVEELAARCDFLHGRRNAALRTLGSVLKERDELLDALQTIADIGEGSTTANSLPNIAKIARAAIAKATPATGKSVRAEHPQDEGATP